MCLWVSILIYSKNLKGVWRFAMSQPATRPPYPFADTVGSQIREARLARGLSVRKFAAQADLSRRHLVELEKGSNVTLLVARNAMRALGLTTLSIGEDEKLTSPPGSAGAQATAEAARQLELGASLILQASATLKAAAGDSSSAHGKKNVRGELAAKVATLIRDFQAHVKSLDSEEQVDALTRLVQASLAPPDHPAGTEAASKRRKTSA
jgi:transcriptional regulator with XRE-family HTH domain